MPHGWACRKPSHKYRPRAMGEPTQHDPALAAGAPCSQIAVVQRLGLGGALAGALVSAAALIGVSMWVLSLLWLRHVVNGPRCSSNWLK
jgi:hypothetical protein